MTRARLAIGAGIVSMLGAYFLRDTIYQSVIVPLAYVLWLAKFYYSSVPQVVLWGLLLFIMLVVVLSNAIPEGTSVKQKAEKIKLSKGNVETLAGWMVKAGQGTYFKWQIANRLGHISLQLKEMSERRARFQSRNDAVENYLDAGVNTSFVDYPNQKTKSTPLDLNPKEVVDYLETQLENHRG